MGFGCFARIVVILGLDPSCSIEEGVIDLICSESWAIVFTEDVLRAVFDNRLYRCTLGCGVEDCVGDFGDESVDCTSLGCTI